MKLRPEGRDGVWLVEPADLATWLNANSEEQIHCFLPLGGVGAIGADWKRETVVELVWSASRCAVLKGTARRQNFNHALAVIAPLHGEETLHMFDVGDALEDDE